MIPMTPTAADRIRQILEDLEAVRENLLALSDDIWLSIDHNDPDALEEGVQFKRSYNDKSAAFDRVASELSAIVQQYTSVRIGAAEETGSMSGEQNQRIIAELNREEPHTLNEDFTYRRPHGFVLDGQGTAGITTWQRMYELVCQQLFDRDSTRFHSLCDHPDFISRRGNHTVTRNAEQLRKPLLVRDNLHIEANLSANGICDIVRRLLAAYELPTEHMQIFLRQDRDAARQRTPAEP